MKKTNYRVQLRPKTPNPRLHDRRDPRSYLGDPDPEDTTDALWQLFYNVITGRTPVNSPKITPQTPTTINQSKP
jgi:hypothetical protein